MIKELLDNLPSKDTQKLMYAFENGFSHYIELPNNTFIGVNVRDVKHLKVTENVGTWFCGNINKGE